MRAAFGLEANRLREQVGLTAEQIARATGAAPSTVRGWIGHRSSGPGGQRAERIAELSAIIDRLMRVMPKESIPVWLSKPIEALNERKPLDLIAKGDYRQLAEVISGIEDPGAV
jgi:transcriptional regulator with XRE-family HTH domain